MTNFVPTALAAAAIGFSALMIGAPGSHASEKSECESKGGTYSETTIGRQQNRRNRHQLQLLRQRRQD
jgi:hypothetical protein